MYPNVYLVTFRILTGSQISTLRGNGQSCCTLSRSYTQTRLKFTVCSKLPDITQTNNDVIFTIFSPKLIRFNTKFNNSASDRCSALNRILELSQCRRAVLLQRIGHISLPCTVWLDGRIVDSWAE